MDRFTALKFILTWFDCGDVVRGRVGFIGSQHSRGEGEAAHQEYGGAGEVSGPHGGGGGGGGGGDTGAQQRGRLSVRGHVWLLLSPPTNQYVM